MCAGDFLHIAGCPSSPSSHAVMLIQVSQKPEPLPVPGSLKHHKLVYSLPVSPLSTSSWVHPLSGTFTLGQSCSRRLGSVFWALTSIRNVWSCPCGKHRWMEFQLLLCFPSSGMPELHGRGWQGSLFFQKSPCKPPQFLLSPRQEFGVVLLGHIGVTEETP